MANHLGHISKFGYPLLRVSVCANSGGLRRDFEAVIDTGFTGFLLLPLKHAVMVDLEPLNAATSYTARDGKKVPMLLTMATVAIGDEEVSGPATIEMNGHGVVLGMEFLRKSGKVLLVSNRGCALVEEELLTEVAKVFGRIHASPEPRSSAATNTGF